MDQRSKPWPASIDAALATRTDHVTGMLAKDGRKIYIAFDEWNVWYRARGDGQRGRRILESATIWKTRWGGGLPQFAGQSCMWSDRQSLGRSPG